MSTRSNILRLPLALLLLLGLLAGGGCSAPEDRAEDAPGTIQAGKSSKTKRKKLFLAFGGGPTGGTFNFFANKISAIVTHENDHLDISPKGSAGSAENLRSLHSHGVDLSIVYAGDAYLGSKGRLPGDPTSYDKVRALAFLYGAPAQLVVRAEANITSANDLTGKVVAVGNPGSGAALSAERFFTQLGIWDSVDHRNLGYSEAAAEFSTGNIDAFWVLAGFPNSSVIEAASRVPISLVPLGRDAETSGLFEAMPSYGPVVIPAGTYQNQFEDVASFQDASLLCASATTDADAIYDVLSTIFSQQGLASMVNAHRAARGMSVENAVTGVSIPLHPGARTFWKDRGLTLPAP